MPGDRRTMPGGPLAELGMAEADQVASQTIADMAKAPLADVQRVVRTWGVPTALRYFAIAPDAFHDASTPRMVALVHKEAQDGQIDPAQADMIVEHIQHGPPGPPRPRMEPSMEPEKP